MRGLLQVTHLALKLLLLTCINHWPSLKPATDRPGTDQRSYLQVSKISRILTILLFYSISTLPKLDEGGIAINEQLKLFTLQP